MKKILNWTFGSFFRTFGRFIFYILIGIFISYLLKDFKIPKIDIWQVLDVQADTVSVPKGWGMDTTQATRAFIANCSSNNCSYVNSSVSYADNTYDSLIYGSSIYSTHTINFQNYGAMVGVLANQTMLSGYLYSITGYFCSSDNSYFSLTNIYTNNAQNDLLNYNVKPLYQKIYNDGYLIDSNAFYNGTSLGRCVMANGLVVPNVDSIFVGFQIMSSSTGEHTVHFYGYDIQNLGIYNPATKSDINNAISNSGLATASSVNQVQSSVNQINTEISNTNSSIQNQTEQQQQNHKETMDTITDDNINENGTSDFANGLDREYSSLTPFSDFINLPLRWIQLLFSSQNSCQPINLPLPYLNDKTLILPCMTEFWQRMGALGTLIQLVWIAIVGVRIFNGLFLLTCETLDPNPDKDMTKLRTWEL